MAALVEAYPFPWSSPLAQALHGVLCEAYPTSKAAMFVVERAGLNPAYLTVDQPAYLLWREVLNESANTKLTRALVTAARDLNPRNPKRGFLDALLAAAPEPVPFDLQPQEADGAPQFLSADDQVTEPEALLFHDDLTLSIGRIPWLIGVLQRLQSLGSAVCRMRVAFPAGTQNGTAFRIAPNLLLTNWHVLHLNGAAGTAATAEFGYDDDGQGGGLASTAFTCAMATVKGDAADDWAVIEPESALPDEIPIVKLSEAIEPTDGAFAFIVQHPGGERKRIAFVRNQVTAVTDRIVHYLSDTQGGSSGSPVFHETGRLMALHRAGGRPQEVAGKVPLRKNEGVCIPRIRSKLEQLGMAVP